MPATHPAKPTLSKREATRLRVIEAAISLIYEEGFYAANTNRIAERAGVSWGVLQYHFGDKDGLLEAISSHIFEQFEQRLRAAEPVEGDLQQKIRHLIDTLWKLVNGAEYRVSIAIHRNAGRDPNSSFDGQKQLVDWQQKITRFWHQLLRDESIDETTRTIALRLLFATLRGMADEVNPGGKQRKQFEQLELQALEQLICQLLTQQR